MLVGLVDDLVAAGGKLIVLGSGERVGGLADTVIDANEAGIEAGVATGIVFAPAEQFALRDAILRAVRLYGRPKLWRKMQRRGMKSDVSWDLSAEKYAKLYGKLLGVKEDDGQQDD
jgi:starch synthase